MVTVASNNFGVEPMGRAKRFDKKQKVEKFLPQPYAISQYNKYMGGVDLHDNGIANYRCRVLGKKWWWPIFVNAIDSLVVNAWKFYNIVNETPMSQLDFKSFVALRLIKTERTAIIRNLARVIDEIRYDNIGHVVVRSPENRRRCRICHSQTVYTCQRCNVHLHTTCFAEYHTAP